MDLGLIAKIGTIKNFDPHGFICHENDLGNEMYILLKGKVGIYLNSFMDDAFEVDQLIPGCFFGEMSLLENMPRSATIIALEEGATVIEIKKEHFNELIASHSDVSFRIMKSLSDRVNKLIGQLSDKSSQKASSYLQDACYQLSVSITEKSFCTLCLQSNEKALTMIKHLSHMVREINEELIDLSSDKQLSLDAASISGLDVIPKEHQTYSFDFKDSYKDILLEKSMKCPVCGHEFKNHQPRTTKLKLIKLEKDLRRVYEDLDPLWFNITTCPECLYSNYSNEFNSLSPKYIKEAASCLEKVKNLKNGLKFNSLDINTIFTQYYLTMISSVGLYRKDLKLGKLWLNLSWLYQDVGDEKMYVLAYTNAFEYYNKAFLGASYNLSESDEQSLLIILGALYTRQGEYEKARKTLFTASHLRGGNKQLENIAAEQLQEIKVLNKGEK